MEQSMDVVAARAAAHPLEVLAEIPWLGAAIDADARAGRFGRWGRSTVIDENVGAAVIPEALFAALHARAGLRAEWPVGNAGLVHVYGYLLSTVPTPYGLKRERWLDGVLARAYGLPADAFVPWTSPRTLLDRVTEAADGVRRRFTVRRADIGGLAASVALHRAAPDGAAALVYALGDRLITTFPVASPDAVLTQWDAEPPRLRWNAVGE